MRAAIAQLCAGPVPEGLKCDIKSLCTLAGVPRATLYRTYPHLKAEFERHRAAAINAGGRSDPRRDQIERLKSEAAQLRERLRSKDAELDTLKNFRAEALSQLTAQHDEITTLREQIRTAGLEQRGVVPLRRT